jgi:hypothetical protein
MELSRSWGHRVVNIDSLAEEAVTSELVSAANIDREHPLAGGLRQEGGAEPGIAQRAGRRHPAPISPPGISTLMISAPSSPNRYVQ